MTIEIIIFCQCCWLSQIEVSIIFKNVLIGLVLQKTEIEFKFKLKQFMPKEKPSIFFSYL